MDRLSLLLENSKRAIRYWWLLLLVGVILIVAGISVFLYPVQSYLGLSVLFGWLMLVSGVLEAVLVWVSISLLFAGAAACSMALQLRTAHRCMEGKC